MKTNLLLLLIFICGIANAQVIWTVYNTSNSAISSDNVFAVAIDTSNNKWVATTTTYLDVFTGYSWFNFDDYQIYFDLGGNLVIESNGNKWLGSNQEGLSMFNGTEWINYNTSNSGLPSNTVYAIAIDADNNKWIGTKGGGLAKFDGTTWTVYNTYNSGLPDNEIYCLAIDSIGNIWIGTHYSGIVKFDGSTWTNYNTLNSLLPANDVYAIAIAPNGDIWTGSAYNGVTIFNENVWANHNGNVWTNYTIYNSGLPDNYIRCFAFSQFGDVWIGTGTGGLVKFDGTNWVTYNTSNSGLPDNRVWQIAVENNQQKIWIATLGGGLASLDLNNVGVNNMANDNVTIYPNPCFTKAILQSDETLINATLIVYNLLGQVVKEMDGLSGQAITIYRDNLPTGQYCIRLMQNNKAIATKKLIIVDN